VLDELAAAKEQATQRRIAQQSDRKFLCPSCRSELSVATCVPTEYTDMFRSALDRAEGIETVEAETA
jgi:transcription elongation factor Elf1